MQRVRIRLANTRNAVIVQPIKRYARTYIMGTVMLADVTVTEMDGNLYLVGDLVSEHETSYPPNHPSLIKRLTCVTVEAGRLLTIGPANDRVDVTDGHFDVAYLHGGNLFYVSEF